jgi:hypothetical protein
MLMHTNVFGRYDGPEEVLSVTPCYTEINVTANYAPVVTTKINVVDENGAPLKANVEFKIFNYAEFFTAAAKETDDKGRTSITTGYGDMVAWASVGGKFGFVKFTAGKDKNVELVVDKAPGYSATLEMDIVPPHERNTVPFVSEAQAAENVRRFAREDSIRNAYVSTFMSPDEALSFAQSLEYCFGHEKVVAQLLLKSRGNHATIKKFLSETPREERELAYYLLLNISDGLW